MHDIEVLKCKFKDENLRKFLFYYFKKYKRPIRTGNLLYAILSTKIPLFETDPKNNEKTIEKIMKNYLNAVTEREQMDHEIQEIDELIDKKIYKLYGLTKEEKTLIEDHFR